MESKTKTNTGKPYEIFVAIIMQAILNSEKHSTQKIFKPTPKLFSFANQKFDESVIVVDNLDAFCEEKKNFNHFSIVC